MTSGAGTVTRKRLLPRPVLVEADVRLGRTAATTVRCVPKRNVKRELGKPVRLRPDVLSPILLGEEVDRNLCVVWYFSRNEGTTR